jgi:ribose-phosphate pyrophosphokinase
MSTPLIASLPGNESFGKSLGQLLSIPTVDLGVHRFPDGESLIQYPVPVANRDVVLLCTLDRPDEKFLPLLFAAKTARELGASSIGLVAPYLCYMRQDTRFHPGEALSAKIFAATLSNMIDWLVTVDPHLHRLSSLSEIFSVPVSALHADREIATWIAREVRHPLLIGPDAESAQWINRVASLVKCPATVLAKQRGGDREVRVSDPDLNLPSSHSPVILDDIVSTGQTMKETVLRIKQLGAPLPICIGVHAIFSGNAYADLASTGADVVTTNTIRHPTNRIDLQSLVATSVAEHLRRAAHK